MANAYTYNDEPTLIRHAKELDPSAWSYLYDKHYETLYRYAIAILASREEAEDVASQVFTEALKNIDGFKYTGKPILHWLWGIVRNLVADRLRHQKQHGNALDRMPPKEGVEPGPDALLDNIDLLQALNKITEEQREVIVLRFFLGLPAKEVAGMLKKNETAIHALQLRGIGALRRLLSQDLFSDDDRRTG